MGGRWSEETRDFLNQLVRGKVRHEPAVLERRVQQAWRMRWQAILSCSAAKVFAASLLELRGGLGADGDTPSVETDFFSLTFQRHFHLLLWKKSRVTRGDIISSRFQVAESSGQFQSFFS